MNKKFSTLMAGLMLASAFSVNSAMAQTEAKEYKDGKFYLLKTDANNYLAVVSEAGANYGQLYLDATIDGLADTRNALWKVTVTQEKLGDTPKYSFVNVATGQILSVATPEDKTGNVYDPLKEQFIAGSYQEWYNGLSSTGINTPQTFMSYVGKNDVVYLGLNNTQIEVNGEKVSTVDVKRGSTSDAENGLKIEPYTAAIVTLNANELNKELIVNNPNDDKATFTLSFNRDVTADAAKNLFAATPLKASNVFSYTDGATGAVYYSTTDKLDENGAIYAGYEKEETDYVRLYSKDNGYIVVDTTLHAGSEASKQLPMFAYDDPDKDVVEGNNVKRLPESFNFAFAYDPSSNRVLIKAQKYVKKMFNTNSGKPAKIKGADGNDAYTYWPTVDYIASNGTTSVEVKEENFVSNAYIRLVELSDVRELTVASEGGKTLTLAIGTGANGADNLSTGMLTTVTIGKGLMSYEPTTIATGLYTIQYKGSNKGTGSSARATDNYYIANLGGAFGYAEQAKNQLFDHMPAAQWYVEQNGTIATAPVTITNREFFDFAGKADLKAKFKDLQAFKGEDGTVFFLGGAFKEDTLKFIPVDAKLAADSLLGYKHVDAEQASVETYVFNYLHGLTKDNGLNTPSDKDSLVRVDETGEKVAFRLIPVVEHDSYGIQLDAKKTGVANLIRNAYYVEAYDNLKFTEDGENRYLTYDQKSKKYVMSKTPTAFFLKENNCADGTHYYALVEANLFEVKTADLNGAFNATKFYKAELAGMTAGDETPDKDVKAYLEDYDDNTIVKFYSKNGQPIVEDASKDVPVYAYMADTKDENKIKLMRVTTEGEGGKTVYYYYNAANETNNIADKDYLGDKGAYLSMNYASSRVSVDDNTLDLTQAVLNDKWTAEIRVSAFEAAINDAPLYRRFNGANGEFGTAANAPLNLKFFRHNNKAEYLFENKAADNAYREGIVDKTISFLGVNNAYQFEETATRSYTMFVDTAYVRNNTRMPQYLIGVRPEVVEGDTILCDASTHQHATPEEALACEHTQIKVGFTRAMYLFNAQDSIDAKNYDYQGKAAYGAQGYTRLAFKDAVHANDTLYILNPGVTTEQLKASNLMDDKMFAKKIGLGENKHKNVVFQFRLIDEENNRFLIESEADPAQIAPMKGGWVKVQNGVPVIARYNTFNEAIAQADVFDVTDEIKYEATANDEIAVEGVSVVAGNGQVTIMGAAGKNVTITNILGKVIASQVIASDNATIAVPAGIVAVAVEGEAAVKAIVK